MSCTIYLMYYDRYEEATTSLELSKFDIDHVVLCHDNGDKFKCIGKNGTLIQTNEPKGIQNNFNWALRNTKEGDWCIFLSDDYVRSKVLQGGNFVNCEITHPLNELKKAIGQADRFGVSLIGLNSVGNAYFVKNDFAFGGLVDGRCYAIKKTGFLFDEKIQTMTDYYATAWHLRKFKKNLILNYTFMEFKRYSKKGIGSLEDREEQKREDCLRLKQLFPDMVHFKEKPGQASGTHIVLRSKK